MAPESIEQKKMRIERLICHHPFFSRLSKEQCLFIEQRLLLLSDESQENYKSVTDELIKELLQ